MRLHVGGIGIAVLAVAAIGCSDRNQPLPAGPRMQTAAPVSSLTCDFKSLNQLATHYFNAAEAKVVRTILSQMQDSGAFSFTAKNGGFDVMTHIAANVKAGNTDVADASNLTNGLLACMYNRSNADSLALPGTFPEDFTVATNPATFGAYEVRGGAVTDPVFSRSVPPLSGVAPDAATWGATLSGNSPQRAFLYGAPGLLPNTYEWRVVPRNATFAPAVIVGVCIAAGADSEALLHEEHVGLLPFRDAAFLPGGCPAFGTRSWSVQFASRLARWGMDLLGPRALSATTFFNPGGLAGSTGSLRSLFGPEHADTVVLTFVTQPSDVRVNTAITPAVQVQATNKATGSTVANVTITLSAVNNNGTTATLSGDTTHVTDYAGLATFTNLSESKTGGYVLVASGSVGDRPAIFVLQGTSARFNVKP